MSDEILAVLIMIAGTIVLLLWVPTLESLERTVKGFRMSAGGPRGNMDRGAHAASLDLQGSAGGQNAKPQSAAQ